jgi:hypothetical protein
MKKVFLFFATLFITTQSGFSAPMPLTSSSYYFSVKKGLFRSEKGFLIHAEDSSWAQVPAPQQHPYIEVVYAPINVQGTSQASLTVRSDTLKKGVPLETYAKSWQQDYVRFGFDILSAQPVRVGVENAFLVDLVHADQKQQLRQVLFLRGNHVVTTTCKDSTAQFSESLKNCNAIVRNFKWVR